MARTVQDDPPVLAGHTFVRRLGAGGYAEVFLYEQNNTHLRVAVKVLFKENLTDRIREQFAAEANAMAELADHPNIVQVFQADVTSDGRPYLVMKYYPQLNLAARARAERLSVPEVLQIGVRISCAVETAHRVGILHRDIKPANILTSQYGEPGLADFGIATKNASGDQGEGLSIPWSAPEVVFALSPGDRTSDVYSLGATLWHLLVGRSPFELPGGDNSAAALMRRIREQAVPRTGRQDVPDSLERLLAQAMAKRPSDRPQSALHLARALQAIESEQRWAPTPLVLLDEATLEPEALGGNDSADSDEPKTRLRQAQAVIAQPAKAVGVEPVDGADTGVETVRRGVVAQPQLEQRRNREARPSEESATIRRPTAVKPAVDDNETAAEPGKPPARSNTKWKLVLAASIVVVVAVVGTALALSGGGAKSGPSTTTITAPAPTLAIGAPDVPVVTGSRLSASQVKFTWTVGNSQPGDRYYWKEPGGTATATTGQSVTVPAPASGKVCVTVEVVRGNLYADSSLTCAG